MRHLTEIGGADRYRRFQAVDGKAVAHEHTTRLSPGNLGCWLSHVNLLRANFSSNMHLHVIEDDTVFAKGSPSLFESFLKVADEQLKGWDLIFTDIWIPTDSAIFYDFFGKMRLFQEKGHYSFVNLARIPFAATSSYFVNKSSIAKLANLLSGKWTSGLPVDLYLQALVNQGAVNAYATLPFLTSVSPEGLKSDIRGNLNHSRRIFDVYRRAFFRDADIPSLTAEMQELIKGATVPPLVNFYLNAVLYSLSEQYEPF